MPSPLDLTQRFRAATAPAPEVDAGLREVMARVRRQTARRRAAVLGVVGILAVSASLWVVRSDDPDKSVFVGPSPTPTHPSPNDAAPVLSPLWTGAGLGMSASFGATSGDLTAASSEAVFTATGFGSTTSTGDSGKVTAVNRDTGTERWAVELDGPAFIQGVTGTTVIANNQENRIVGLDAIDGTVRWEISLADRGLDGYGAVTSAVGEPVSAIGLSASNEGDLRPPVVVGVDTNTGEIVWTTPLEPGTDLTFGTPPLDDGQTVFVSTPSHPGSAPENLAHLIDVADGSIEWDAGLGGGQGFGDHGAVIAGPFVHLPAEPDVLTLNRGDGSMAWTRPGRDAVYVNDALWIIGTGNALDRLDPATGEPLSTIASPVDDPAQILDLGNGDLGIVSYTSMMGIEADGQERFRAVWPARLADSVRVDDRLLIVATGDAAVSAYSLDAAPTTPTRSSTDDASCPNHPSGNSPATFDPNAGTYVVELESILTDEVAFIVNQWLVGQDAQQAYDLANPGFSDAVPGNHFIARIDPELRTARVSDDVRVLLVRLASDGDPAVSSGTFDELADYLTRTSEHPYWLTITNGVITEICEQHTP